MNANTKLEIAVEILLKEKTKMYQGDNEIIEKIINVYGKEVKGE